jgi:ATP-dependent helicase/nuclease subunit A
VSPRGPLPDQAERDRAIAERARHVLVDAGAGTGKTTILVERLLAMVAPAEGPAVPIHRLAAITFTRKAAGELRLRIRERLLAELARPDLGATRGGRLREALAGLDTAWVGTIHGFADRLLRLRPVEAQLSPSYEIAEDDEALARETYEALHHAVEHGTLAAELAGTGAAARAGEAAATLLGALGAGLRAESEETEWQTRHGLDGLVAGFLRHRDVPPPDAPAAPFDRERFRAVADRVVAAADALAGRSPGGAWLVRLRRRLAGLREQDDPLELFRALRPLLAQAPPGQPRKRDLFDGDDAAWKLWKAWTGSPGHPGLREQLLAPLHRTLATRLVRLFPVVEALYERVKARRRVLDRLDLLVKLRRLLAEHPGVRGDFQGMFDHILVDEFQDTDPLQAEIVLFLAEREPRARRWSEVELRDGALTLVGDPKQSIYRFRRADVAMYDRVRALVAARPHLEVRLSANFRSRPALIDWLNDRFDRVLGAAGDGPAFDPRAGRVRNQRLAAGREEDGEEPAVHVLPLVLPPGPDGKTPGVDHYRALEAEALARYLRWLVERSGVQVSDPLDGRPRPVRYGDVAVLAVSTWTLSALFPALDARGIPHATRGGTLFLSDPLHRQFLLGLRAVADRDDGVAEAALLRPPFFALDPLDLLRERAAARAGREPDEAAGRRAAQARALVRELRRRRLERPPGATARDLLEHTALGRMVAAGPNGAQRLGRLRELCLLLERTAAAEGLDYDAATARLRRLVDDPVPLDPPHPVATEAVQVLTVHQAKGLEFPVVVLWDGRGRWDARLDSVPWRMDRDERGWTLSLDGLAWEEPEGLGLRATEKSYLDAERRRVVYVAATRARDLLVLPQAGDVTPGQHVCGDLLEAAPAHLVRVLEPCGPGREPAWGADAPVPAAAPAAPEPDGLARWLGAAAEAARPRFRPVAVSAAGAGAGAADDDAEEPVGPPRPRRAGRFGPRFGETVHVAIGLALGSRLEPLEAVRRAAGRTGLEERLDEAAADVARALAALRAEGLGAPGPALRLEYPVAGAAGDGRLLAGYADLVGVGGGGLVVLDFKTDAPPAGPVAESHPEYVAQVRAYAELLGAAGLGPARAGLLFTADGLIRWLP